MKWTGVWDLLGACDSISSCTPEFGSRLVLGRIEDVEMIQSRRLLGKSHCHVYRV